MLRKWIFIDILVLMILNYNHGQEIEKEMKDLFLEDSFLGKNALIKDYLKHQQKKINLAPSLEEILSPGNYSKEEINKSLQQIRSFMESQGLFGSSRYGSKPGPNYKPPKPNQLPGPSDYNHKVKGGTISKKQYRYIWTDMLKATYKILKDNSYLTKDKTSKDMMDFLYILLQDIDILSFHNRDIECPYIYNNIGNLCLSVDFLDTFLDYHEARLYCQVVKGGDLVMWRDGNEFDRIQKYLKMMDPERTYSYWIGLTDEEIENEWKFIDGRTARFGAPYWGVSFDECDFINNTCGVNEATCAYWNSTCTASNATCANWNSTCNGWNASCSSFTPRCAGWNNYSNNCVVTNATCVTWKANCTTWHDTCDTLYYNCNDWDNYISTCDSSTGTCLSYDQACSAWQRSCSTFFTTCHGWHDYSTSCNSVNTSCVNWKTNCSNWHYTCHEHNDTCLDWSDRCHASHAACGHWNITCTTIHAPHLGSHPSCRHGWKRPYSPCTIPDRQLQPEFNNVNENYALLLNMDSNYIHDASIEEAEEWNTIPLCQFIPERDKDNFQYGEGIWEDWNDYNEFKGWYSNEKEKNGEYIPWSHEHDNGYDNKHGTPQKIYGILQNSYGTTHNKYRDDSK